MPPFVDRYAEAFANPKGPGDRRPTALRIICDNDLVNKEACYESDENRLWGVAKKLTRVVSVQA